MNKKKLILISVVVMAIMVIGAGSAFAATENQGNASLEEKLEALQERVDQGDMTQAEADAIVEQITSCDGDCDEDGECADRPEEGRGIFGNGANDGTGARRGTMDGAGKGAGNGIGEGNGNGTCDND